MANGFGPNVAPVPPDPALVTPRPTAPVQTEDFQQLPPMQPPAQLQYGPGHPVYEQNRQGWTAFLQNPQVQAALLQFGTAMMADKPVGTSPMGGLATAIGEGGEAAGRVGELQRQEATSAEERAQKQQALSIEEQRAQEEARGHTLTYEAALAGQKTRAQIAQQASRDRIDMQIQAAAARGATGAQLAQLRAWGNQQALLPDPTGDDAAQYNALQSKMDNLMTQMGAGPSTPDAAAGGGVPPIPDNLKGQNPGWSKSKQRWILQDGSEYNQQGVPVPGV